MELGVPGMGEEGGVEIPRFGSWEEGIDQDEFFHHLGVSPDELMHGQGGPVMAAPIGLLYPERLCQPHMVIDRGAEIVMLQRVQRDTVGSSLIAGFIRIPIASIIWSYDIEMLGQLLNIHPVVVPQPWPAVEEEQGLPPSFSDIVELYLVTSGVLSGYLGVVEVFWAEECPSV